VIKKADKNEIKQKSICAKHSINDMHGASFAVLLEELEFSTSG